MTTDVTDALSISDPRPRVISFLLLVAAAMVVLSGTAAAAVVLVYVVALYAAARRPARALVRHLRRLIPVIVLIVLLNGALAPGAPALSLGGHTLLTRAGVEAGVFFSVRLCVLYLATVVLVATTPPEEFAAALFAFVRPLSRRAAARVAFYGFVSMSFVPLFADELERVRVAQSFRGATLSGGPIERARGLRLLVVPLVVSAVRRSEQLAMVTHLRGLEDRLGESLVIRRARVFDAALPLVTAVVVIAAGLGLR